MRNFVIAVLAVAAGVALGLVLSPSSSSSKSDDTTLSGTLGPTGSAPDSLTGKVGDLRGTARCTPEGSDRECSVTLDGPKGRLTAKGLVYPGTSGSALTVISPSGSEFAGATIYVTAGGSPGADSQSSLHLTVLEAR